MGIADVDRRVDNMRGSSLVALRREDAEALLEIARAGFDVVWYCRRIQPWPQEFVALRDALARWRGSRARGGERKEEMDKQDWIEEANRNLVALQRAEAEAERWKETARQYAQNAGYWRREVERLRAVVDVRPEVLAFAWEMERQLRENDDKGGWRDMTKEQLIERMKDEIAEIECRVRNPMSDGSQARRLTEEAADVANFAMMFADNFGDYDIGKARAALSGQRSGADEIPRWEPTDCPDCGGSGVLIVPIDAARSKSIPCPHCQPQGSGAREAVVEGAVADSGIDPYVEFARRYGKHALEDALRTINELMRQQAAYLKERGE